MTPFCLVYFRYRREGKEHGIEGRPDRRLQPPQLLRPVPDRRDPALAAADDYVAKVELFTPRQAWWISRLGAFPIRRGESDEDSVATARMVVERGGTVCIFPEGTGSAAAPRRPQARRRPPRAGDRRPGPADRGDRHRARPPRLEDPPAPVRVRLGRAIASRERPSPRRRWPRRSPSGSGPTSYCSGKRWAACRR